MNESFEAQRGLELTVDFEVEWLWFLEQLEHRSPGSDASSHCCNPFSAVLRRSNDNQRIQRGIQDNPIRIDGTDHV